MTVLNYRHATNADLPFMVHLIAIDDVTASSDDGADANAPHYQQALAAIAADPNQAIYIAEFDGQPVGTFQLSFIPGIMRRGMWRGLIESVHVSPDHRNRGFGKDMMGWAIEHCRARGCGMVQLTSNKKRVDAHRFYRTLGFAQSHEGFKFFL